MSNTNDLAPLFLSNYLKYTHFTRGMLLKMDFDALEKIQSNTWFYKFEGDNVDEQTTMVKSIIQLEIIAKIMIYVEDLAIIAESLLKGVNYYTLLDKKETPKGVQDVGDIVQKLFEKMKHLSKNDFAKIMSFGDPKDYAENDEEKQLLEEALKFEKNEFLKLFKKIKDFADEHHAVFRRYKHAGFPMVPGLRFTGSLPGYLKFFTSTSLVFVNEDPFYNPKVLPFSDKVIEMYRNIIGGIQAVLEDIIHNKLYEIRQLKKRPPICYHPNFAFSPEQHKKFKTIFQRSDESNPATNIKFDMNVRTTEKSEWYSNLDNLLEECDKIKKINEEYERLLNS